MSILNHLSQLQVRDIIGSAAGTSQTEGGYQILPAVFNRDSTAESEQELSATDFLITDGRFYIDGILCELNRGTLISVERRSSRLIQIPTLMLDGRLFVKNQWLEIEVLQGEKTSIKLNKIVKVNSDDFTLELEEEIDEPQSGESIKLRRLTTFTTQADHTNLGTLSPEAVYLVYLDVWQRHVTALDDRDLQEVALNGLDTATRLQTLAQVKLIEITKDLETDQAKQSIDLSKKPSTSAFEALPTWQALSNRAVTMTATTALDPDSAIDTSGSYQSGENRLYRVEIHQGGTIDDAIFKWSRDNGSIVSAIDRIEGDVIRLKGSIQDEYNLFGSSSDNSQSQENPWVEIITEAQELSNEPGILVQVRAVKPPNLILLDLSQIQGASLAEVKRETAEQEKYKVRRWDGQSGTNSSWQLLERGIQIQFNAGNNSQFKTGDYWLISARENRPIGWPRDLPQPKQQLGRPIAQSPVGIQHRYGILAVVKTKKVNDVIVFCSAIDNDFTWNKADLRTQFIPLLNRGILSGLDSQEARLRVQGDSEQTATGKIEAIATDPPKIRITETKAQIFKGYTVTIEGKTNLVTNAERKADSLDLTLNAVFETLPSRDQTTTFRYQQPIIRFESQDAIAPQFFLNGKGNIGINTLNPDAKLDIRATASESSIDLLQVKNAAGASLFNVQSDGKVGIGIDSPQARLDVQDALRVTTGNSGSSAFLQVQPQVANPILFVSHPGNLSYSFDQNITIQKGGLAIQSGGGARISGQVTAENGILVETGGMSVKGDAIFSDVSGQERLTVKGNTTTIAGDVTLKSAGIDRISVSNAGTTINGNVTLATGNLTVANGTLTIGDVTFDETGLQVDRPTRFNTLTVKQAITLGNDDFKIDAATARFKQAVTFEKDVAVRLNGQEKITLNHPSKPVTIDLPNQTLSLQTGNRPLVALSTFQAPNQPKLSLAGNAVIGADYVNSSIGLVNGLLVQGHVGIGLFDKPLDGDDQLQAKLEVRGTTNNASDAALNITNQRRDSLLHVRNDGRVFIATGDLKPTIRNINDEATSKIKLYVEGSAYLNGNLFAQEAKADSITGGKIEQLSSRSIKENIIGLSSQEAAAMLKQLNPVKFNYTLLSDRTLHAGFIAEDVPELLTSPDRQAVRLLDVVAVLTKTVKDQREGIFLLNRVVKQQQAAIAALLEKVTQLENEVASNRSDR